MTVPAFENPTFDIETISELRWELQDHVHLF